MEALVGAERYLAQQQSKQQQQGEQQWRLRKQALGPAHTCSSN
jgi:hypothetical protein